MSVRDSTQMDVDSKSEHQQSGGVGASGNGNEETHPARLPLYDLFRAADDFTYIPASHRTAHMVRHRKNSCLTIKFNRAGTRSGRTIH